MSRHWLLVDGHNAAWRAHHALRKAVDGFGQAPRTVLYGVLRDVDYYRRTLNATHLAFFFDMGTPLRKQVLATYKVKPDDGDPVKKQERADVLGQLAELREHVLPRMGFANVIGAAGYEADDLIASAVRNLPKGDTAVILSSDKDLFQLLSRAVAVYSPATKTLVDEAAFVRRYGCSPRLWVRVKALAGDDGDRVPGIDGVGEVTAVKYLHGGLATTTKAFQAIRAGRELVNRNRQLVALPYAGTPKVVLVPDAPTDRAWDGVVEGLGMAALKRNPFADVRPKRRAATDG